MSVSETDGTVVEVHGIRATVLLHDGTSRRVRCRPQRDRTKPVVGDRVRVSPGRDVIEATLPRARSLWRPKEQATALMATHVDRVIVVMASRPRVKLGFLDRLVITAQAEEIDTVIAINKADLPEIDQALELLLPYQELGYRVLRVSAETGEGMDGIAQLIGEGLSMLVGQSGVGKSTILNRLFPGVELRTGELSRSSGKGRHTTSVSTCHEVGRPWPEGGLLVDTPGVRTFGLYGLEPVQLAGGFVDFRPFLGRCRFRDCLHESEPSCTVRAAVAEGEVTEARYTRYLGLLRSLRAGEG